MASINDLTALGYTVEQVGWSIPDPDSDNPYDGPAVYTIKGYGIDTMVSADDQEAIDAFTDPAAQTERVFQHDRPDAASARRQLEMNGYTVARPDDTKDVFTISGGDVSLTKQKPDDLVAQAEALLTTPA